MILARKRMARAVKLDDEAIRPLASRLALEGGHGATVAVVCGKPGEGSAAVLSSLARMLELYPGRRVFVVDWNLEAPELHKIYGLPLIPGATDVLAGAAGLREAIYVSGSGRLAVLPVGSPWTAPQPPFGPDGLVSMLPLLQATGADIVLVALPPLLSWPEAMRVTAFCKQTLVVVRAGRTQREDGARLCQRLVESGATIAGAVLTEAD